MDSQEIITFLIFVFWIVMGLLGQKRKADQRKKQRELQKQQGEQFEPESNKPAMQKAKPKPPVIIYDREEPEIDVLEEIFGRSEEPQISPQVPKVKPFTQPASVAGLESIEEKNRKEGQIAEKIKQDYEKKMLEFKRDLAKAFEKKKVHKNTGNRGSYAKPVKTNFDLRKAVIYSEILKRPYD